MKNKVLTKRELLSYGSDYLDDAYDRATDIEPEGYTDEDRESLFAKANVARAMLGYNPLTKAHC